jgi:hypothetical protein
MSCFSSSNIVIRIEPKRDRTRTVDRNLCDTQLSCEQNWHHLTSAKSGNGLGRSFFLFKQD